MRESLLGWQKQRYLKWSIFTAVVCVALYVSQTLQSTQPPNGGTWQGYVLGTLGAGLIIWLSLLGVRKRKYRSTLGTVQGWTSAHVYLGIVLLIAATLHCAAQFGWNVHTLAYVLMCLVIASGVYGLYVYMHLPTRIAENSSGKNNEQWLAELVDIDEEIRKVVRRTDADIQLMALSALELTRLGGGVWQQLRATDRSMVQMTDGGRPVANAEQSAVIDVLSKRIPDARKAADAEVLNELLALFGRRQFVLHLLRRDTRLRGLVKVWLALHIPLTAALLGALAVHIISVFLYW